MTTLFYAGIGARATPGPVLADMTTIAAWLARIGWYLATAGRVASLGRGTTATGPNCHVPPPVVLDASALIAARLHPAWHRCSPPYASCMPAMLP